MSSLRPRAARPRPRPTTPSLQPSKLVNDSVQVYDNGNLLGPTDHSIQFSYPKSFPGTAGTCTTHDNTATVKNNQTLLATSNTVTVEVCAGKDLTVSKTANASFTRTYKWTISKSVAAPTSVTMPAGSSATFNYSVNVASAGYADSGWVATGKITVANPNDWEAVRVNVTDVVDNGGVCTVTNGTGVLVPAGGAVTLDYSCAYASAPNPASGLNTATATWNSSTYSTPHGSATGTAGFAFGTPTTETNKTVTVTDTFNGSTTVLGTVTYPGPATYTYSRTVIAPATGCVTYPNTARISETGQLATASVQICGICRDGCPHDRLLAEQERPGHHRGSQSGAAALVPEELRALLRRIGSAEELCDQAHRRRKMHRVQR